MPHWDPRQSAPSRRYLIAPRAPTPTLFPYTTLFRSAGYVVPPLVMSPASETRSGLRSMSRNIMGDARRISRCRSEEHTSELQSPYDLVCRLLLEKKNIFSNGKRAVVAADLMHHVIQC